MLSKQQTEDGADQLVQLGLFERLDNGYRFTKKWIQTRRAILLELKRDAKKGLYKARTLEQVQIDSHVMTILHTAGEMKEKELVTLAQITVTLEKLQSSQSKKLE